MKSLGKYKILTLLAGIATALVIVFSQLFYFQAATYCQKKAETEQREQKTEGHESYISIPSSTIFSTSHIEVSQDFSFVLGILFENKPEEERNTEITLPASRLFQTLFRFIISPNAP